MMSCGISNALTVQSCEAASAGDTTSANCFGLPLSPTVQHEEPAAAELKLLTPGIASPRDGVSVASPSPCLLNPLSREDWHASSSRSHAYRPQIESFQNDEVALQRLQKGYRVVLHRHVGLPVAKFLSLSEDREYLQISDDPDGNVVQNEEEISGVGTSPIVLAVPNICELKIHKTASNAGTQSSNEVHPLTSLTVVLTEATADGHSQFDLEAESTLQREAIASALLLVMEKLVGASESMQRSANGPCLMPSKRVLAMRRNSSIQNDADLSPLCECPNSKEQNMRAVTLSPLRRTQIHLDALAARSEVNGVSSTPRDVGAELTLVRAEGERLSTDTDEILSDCASVLALPTLDSVEFTEVAVDQTAPPSRGMVSDPEDALPDRWCGNPTCTKALKDLTEHLHSVFESLERGLVPRKGDLSKANPDREELLSRHELDELLSPAASDTVKDPGLIVEDSALMDKHVNGYLIRNRAAVSNASARRWQRLQSEMTFVPVIESNRKRIHFLETTKSLDTIDIGPASAAGSRQNECKHSNGSSMTTGLLESLLAPFVAGSDDGKHGEELFYDSDPEDSRLISSRQGPRRMAAELTNKVDTKDLNTLTTRAKHSRYRAFKRKSGKKIGEKQARDIVEIMKTEQLHLLWHRSPTNVEPTPSPKCVTVWIERGNYLSRKFFVQPKLMWLPAFESNLDSRRLNISKRSPEHLDLVDILCIDTSPAIDRKQYPFVHRSRCFTIDIGSEILLFEAQTEREKKRLAFGLKFTVARFASLLAVEDVRVVSEFFEPVSNFPSWAPKWADRRQT